MLFSEYVTTLKKHFSKHISNEALCGILFDSVIIPLDLMNKRGDPLYLDKRTISKIMNDKQNVPVQIRDNIYEPDVLSGLIAYFEDNIVSELAPKRDDLCFQMMELIRADRMVSPQHLAEFQMLATPSSVAAFLAELFVYVVMADVHDNDTRVPDQLPTTAAREGQKHPELVLRGIRDGELSDSGVIEKFLSRPGLPFATYHGKLAGLFERAMSIRLEHSHEMFSYAFGIPVRIDEEDQDLLRDLAKSFDLEIPDDFFDLGHLTRHQFAPVGYGNEGLQGSDEAKKKFGAICGILDTYDEMRQAIPFLNSFKGTTCLALALENGGTGFDEDVRVQIALPKDSVLSLDDILQLGDDVLDYMAYDCDFNAVFGIPRGAGFLAYNSSYERPFPVKIPPMRYFGFADGAPDFGSIIPSLFDFDAVGKGGDWQIEVEFDSVMQHTAVAFPQLVLLKGSLSEVRYTIKSKHMADVVSGSIKVEEAG